MSWCRRRRIRGLCRIIRELPGAPGFVPFITGVLIMVIGVLSYLKFLVMPDMVSGLFIGTGVTLIATGLSEISRFFTSTTELERPVSDLEVFDNVYRVSALLYNPGSVIVKDTKAVMELEYPDPKRLARF